MGKIVCGLMTVCACVASVRWCAAADFVWELPGGVQAEGAFACPGMTFGPAREKGTGRLVMSDAKRAARGFVAFRDEGTEKSFEVYPLWAVPADRLGGTVCTCTLAVTTPPDAVPCRVSPRAADAHVLGMSVRGADSRLNDALFLPESDTLVAFPTSDRVRIVTVAPGRFTVVFTGTGGATGGVRVRRDWFKRGLAPWYKPIDRSRRTCAPTGWMGWNIYFDAATAEDDLKEARAGARWLKPFGLEFWSVESWQGNSETLPVSKFHHLDRSRSVAQFPKGMKALADDLRALGFRPGLWVVPWGTGDTAFYEAHKDWFLRKPDGSPVSNWAGRYLLDPTHPAAQAHVKAMVECYSRAWGYEFFKIDGMWSAPGSVHQIYFRDELRAAMKDPDAVDPFEDWMRFLREAMGADRTFLACSATLTTSGMAACDATRVGGDVVAPGKPVDWGSVKRQAIATADRLYLNNLALWTDPDTLMVNTALTYEEARVASVVVGLPGQVMFAGDKISELPIERIRLVQSTLPVADVLPQLLRPSDALPAPVWNLAVKKPFAAWNTVALVNWGDAEAEVAVPFADLGLDPDGAYDVHEQYGNAFRAAQRGRLAWRVPPHAVRLFAVHPVASAPHFLAYDRHVSLGATDVEEAAFRDGAFRLRVKLVADHPVTVRFLVPAGWNKAVEGAVAEADGRILAFRLAASKDGVLERVFPVK